MELVCKIKERTYNITVGATFSEEYNETLDSGTIVIPHVFEIVDLAPYDDVYIWNKYDENGNEVVFDGYYNKGDTIPGGTASSNSELPAFFKHLLVDSFTKEMIFLGDEDHQKRYNYTINLMSETKGLDVIACPNISVTQSLIPEEKRTCYFFLQQFVNLYSPKIKRKNTSNNEWIYQNKYKLDPNDANVEGSVANIFSKINCPEMSFSNPTLRDVLSQIMRVCDCIPIVKNNVIYALDVSKTKGTFLIDENHTNYIHSGMSSSEFTTAARREYSGALSQTTTQCVEYLGFRCKEDAFMTLENMYLETRFPIYKINKMYLCYYKELVCSSSSGNVIRKPFLCKQDITDLVLHNNVRNAMSSNWSTVNTQWIPREDMHKYKPLTVGYDIGSTKITGWGTKYQYYRFLWWQETKTYIENIIEQLEHANGGLGVYGNDFSFEKIANDEQILGVSCGSYDNDALVPDGLIGTSRFKTIFFILDYEAMYDGAIVHGKENADRDDIVTVDNQSSSLTITERDGLFEYEKLKRLGNENVKIQCRYDSVKQMEEDYNNIIGAVYDNNIVVYHKEYQIYDNGILANFVGTYNYVLRNYFTSVFAKLRTYNYMSYGESVKRAETNKKYLVLSLDKLYYEINNDFLADYNSLLSSVQNTFFNASLVCFENPYQINTGYIVVDNKKYLSDAQRLVSGYSLCFDIKMYDNIAGGVYIKQWQAKLNNNDIEVYSDYDALQEVSGIANLRQVVTLKGSLQEWYILPSSLTDAFIQNIGFYIGTSSVDDDVTFTDNVQNSYDNVINILPKTNQSIDNVMGSIYSVCKDNKELIDYTFQIELLNKNPVVLSMLENNSSIIVSNWFLKLNDLYGRYIKSSDLIDVASSEGETVVPATVICGSYKYFFADGWHAVIVLRIEDEYQNSIVAGAKFKNGALGLIDKYDVCYYIQPQSPGANTVVWGIMFQPLSILEVNTNGNGIESIKVQFSITRYYKTFFEEKFEEIQSTYIQDYILYNENENGMPGYLDFKADNLFDTTIFDWLSDYEPYTPGLQAYFPEHSKDAINGYNARFFDYSKLVISSSGLQITINQPKNIFISTSPNYIDNKITNLSLVDTNHTEFASALAAEGFLVNENSASNIISVINEHQFRFDLAQIDSYDADTTKSIQMWYYDNANDKLLHYVIGFNLDNKIKEQGYVDVYVSLIKSKDERVFDYMNNENYRIVNYLANTDLEYGEKQLCQEIVYLNEFDNLYYSPVNNDEDRFNIALYSYENSDELHSIKSYYII